MTAIAVSPQQRDAIFAKLEEKLLSLADSQPGSHHDFRSQVASTVKYLHKNVGRFDHKFQELLDTGRFILDTHPTHRVILHSSVVDYLKELYYGV